MKPLLLFLIFLSGGGQDESDLPRLVEDLSADQIGVRDEAERKLIRLGLPVIDYLQECAREEEDLEVRARMEEVILLIRRGEWAKRFNPGPSLVTLSEEDLDLEEVCRRLSEQVRSNIDLRYEGSPRRISVSIDQLPFFQALDQLCRKDGNLDFDIVVQRGVPKAPVRSRNIGSKWRLVLRDRPYGKKKRLFQDQFVISMTQIQMSERTDFGRGASTSGKIFLQAAWEADTAPVDASFRLKTLTDDKGGDILDLIRVSFSRPVSFPPKSSVYTHSFVFQTLPPKEVKSFSRIAGELVLQFPLDTDLVRFSQKHLQKGSRAEGATFHAEILEIERAKAGVHLNIRISGQVERKMPKMVMVTDAESEIEGKMTGSQTTFGSGMSWQTYDFSFEVPEDQEVSRLEVSTFKGKKTEVVPVEFRDVRFRP